MKLVLVGDLRVQVIAYCVFMSLDLAYNCVMRLSVGEVNQIRDHSGC